MSKFARSARGNLVDFDLLAIKQQLAMTPTAVGVDQRRKFVDEKDGIRVKSDKVNTEAKMSAALAMAFEAVEASASAAEEIEQTLPVQKIKQTKKHKE